MITIRTKNVHKMKVGVRFKNNPIGSELKWPKSPRVNKGEIDCELVTYDESPAIIITVEQFENLAGCFGANIEDREFIMNQIKKYIAEQKDLTGVINYTPKRN